jgi:hypothetical protein
VGWLNVMQASFLKREARQRGKRAFVVGVVATLALMGTAGCRDRTGLGDVDACITAAEQGLSTAGQSEDVRCDIPEARWVVAMPGRGVRAEDLVHAGLNEGSAALLMKGQGRAPSRLCTVVEYENTGGRSGRDEPIASVACVEPSLGLSKLMVARGHALVIRLTRDANGTVQLAALADQESGLGEGAKIDQVDIRTVESGLIVQYRTSTSIRDCTAQAAEMPRVWNSVVRSRLTDAQIRQVFLSPEDASGQSIAIEFTKNASGNWSAAAPCAITIPVG